MLMVWAVGCLAKMVWAVGCIINILRYFQNIQFFKLKHLQYYTPHCTDCFSKNHTVPTLDFKIFRGSVSVYFLDIIFQQFFIKIFHIDGNNLELLKASI